MRQIHFVAGNDRGPRPNERLLRALFLAIPAVHLVGVLLGTTPQYLAGLEGFGGLCFLTYGAVYYHEQTSRSRLQGTMIDSLLRHLLPVLTFAALVNVTALAYGLGLVEFPVVPHIQVVFIIMTASTLMTATIKLRQNLAGL